MVPAPAPPGDSALRPPPAAAPRPASRWRLAWAAASLVFAGLLAFQNSLHVPFMFDDDPSIANNPTIRHLWPPLEMLQPPATGAPVTSRPLINVSFALNYAVGGLRVEGYHVLNVAAHLAAVLLLFGLIRRTLGRPGAAPRLAPAALPLAWLTALLWAVHPLTTEPVTYIEGRTEVLMAVCYLATLYAALRGAESARPRAWEVGSVVACLAGMACKEVMVSAPLMVLLYDRTFLTGTFRGAWQRRRGFYLSLAGTWLLLALVMVGGGLGSRGGSTGFGGKITALQYLLTQTFALTRYLRLSVWPHPLILDYGTYLVKDPAIFVPCGLVVLALLAATAYALGRRPALGFLGAWFFAVLAPSSSIVPVLTQTMAERRVYLALPAVILVLVLGLQRLLGRGYLLAGTAVALVFAGVTIVRNHVYNSAVTIWEDTIASWPDDPRPHLNLGMVLMDVPGRLPEAAAQFREAIRLRPTEDMTYCCLGSCLALQPGHEAEAEEAFHAALRLSPHSALVHLNYGMLLAKLPGREAKAEQELRGAMLMKTDDKSLLSEAHAAYGTLLLKLPGRRAEGENELREAIRLFPSLPDPHATLGRALGQDGDVAGGIRELETARDQNPAAADVHVLLATLLAKAPGRIPEAIAEDEAALARDAGLWEAHYNLAKLLQGVPARAREALPHLEAAARLAPENADVRMSLGLALAALPDRAADALREFAAAAHARPESEDTRVNYGIALAQVPGREAEAAAEFRAALQINPRDPEAHFRLACVLAGIAGQSYAAIDEYEATLRLSPDYPDAHYDIAQILQSVPARRQEAIGHLRAELGRHPGNQGARDLLAQLGGRP